MRGGATELRMKLWPCCSRHALALKENAPRSKRKQTRRIKAAARARAYAAHARLSARASLRTHPRPAAVDRRPFTAGMSAFTASRR
eukprot:scaffold6808_cov106-Isochrysis_galbana.AAC.5